MNGVNVVKLAPCVRPAGNFVNRAAFVKVMKSSIGIGLERALEVLQMLPRMLALAIGLVSEPDCGRSIFPGGTLVAHIGP